MFIRVSPPYLHSSSWSSAYVAGETHVNFLNTRRALLCIRNFGRAPASAIHALSQLDRKLETDRAPMGGSGLLFNGFVLLCIVETGSASAECGSFRLLLPGLLGSKLTERVQRKELRSFTAESLGDSPNRNARIRGTMHSTSSRWRRARHVWLMEGFPESGMLLRCMSPLSMLLLLVQALLHARNREK